MKAMRLGLLAAVVATLTACSSLPEGRWMESPATSGLMPMTLNIQKDQISAYAGCNRMMGKVAMDGDHLSVEHLSTTMMMCEGVTGVREETLKQLLISNPAVEQSGDQLVLSSPEKSYTFTRQASFEEGVTRFVYIASETAPCTGTASGQCLQIREDENASWTLYYGDIEGFTPEAGTAYRLRIKEFDRPNPPADGTSKNWVLDMIVEQEIVAP